MMAWLRANFRKRNSPEKVAVRSVSSCQDNGVNPLISGSRNVNVSAPHPYYAVIFTSVRTAVDDGYGEMSDRMMALAVQQPGFLGVDSAREEVGITVSSLGFTGCY